MIAAKNAGLIAVMEINREFAEKIRAKYGAKRAYDHEAALLSDPEVDAVYIASPVRMHAGQAKMAAEAGKNILLEKPVAMTVQEGRDVLEYCEARGVKIAAGLMMRFGSHIMSMKRAIAEGRIGRIVSGYSQFSVWLPDQAGNWRQEKAQSGGGAMMDMGVHCIDLVEYITGRRITHVGAINETVVFSYDVEDSSTVMLRLEGGAQCVVQTNFNIPDEAAKWRLEFFGTRGRLLGDTVIGQNDGGVLNAVFMEKNKEYDPAQDHNGGAGVQIPGDFGNMYTREIESFSDSILNDKPLEAPASDALHIQRVMEAAYESWEKKGIVEIGG
jgi:predicted dehydrogenase